MQGDHWKSSPQLHSMSSNIFRVTIVMDFYFLFIYYDKNIINIYIAYELSLTVGPTVTEV